MKNVRAILLLLIFVLPVTADNSLSDKQSTLEPESHHRRVSQMVATLLDRNHYNKISLDDSMSSKIFDRYLEILDHNRRYLLESDVAEFERFRFFMDDFIQTGNLKVPFVMYNRFYERLKSRMNYIDILLESEFDYSLDEFYEPERSEKPWAKTASQLDSIWRKKIKHEALNLKLAGKDWDETKELLTKRYHNIEKRMGQSQSEDVFQLFLNAFASSIDPHTSYFSPKAKDDFNIHMSRSLEGIGASLRTEDDYTTVVEIIPGGPADLDGRLQPNDKIVGVAQGEDSAMVDVVGWRIDDVVQLIRGPKETIVRLQVLKADALPTDPPELIRIVRDKVRLENQTAKSDTLILDPDGKSITLGIITIPAFYFDLEGYRNRDPDYKSTTRDVEKILKEYQELGVDGVIIDLRRNGGGFLSEAISLTGLFIDEGPVVQVRDVRGRINVESDTDPDILYSGPLAVLVDQFSASASEIFAAAIQDYDRGIIIGNQTFGKGTVQNAIDLNRYFPNSSKKFGQLKLTIAKFYRVNGGSTQHVGVIPDVTLPSRFDHDEIGESAQKNALLWDQISPTDYSYYDKDLDQVLTNIKSRHSLRVSTDPEFSDYMRDIEKNKEAREITRYSLNEEVRKAEREKSKAEKNEAKEEDEDLFLNESAQILGDYINLSGVY